MDTDTKELLNFTLRYLLLNFIIIIIGMRKRIITGDKQEVCSIRMSYYASFTMACTKKKPNYQGFPEIHAKIWNHFQEFLVTCWDLYAIAKVSYIMYNNIIFLRIKRYCLQEEWILESFKIFIRLSVILNISVQTVNGWRGYTIKNGLLVSTILFTLYTLPSVTDILTCLSFLFSF